VNFNGIFLGAVILGVGCVAWGQDAGTVELKQAPPTANTTLEPYNFKDPGVFDRVLAERGIPFLGDYDLQGCLPLNEQDPCLPSGYLDAIEKGEPWESAWKAELAMRQQDLMGADKLLRKLRKKYPKNSKVRWLMAKNIFFRTEVMEKEAKEVKGKLLEEGVKWAKECVEMAPKDINCLLHYGTLVGRSSTNAGIFKTLSKGAVVEGAWLGAVSTKQHYRFPSGNTSLGATYYGLGIYYRLVPDSWWLDLFFGIRGDINRAIKYLERALGTKADQVELYTELAAANFCKYDREDTDTAKEAANRWISRCLKLKAKDPLNEISQRHCKKLKQDPDLGCGYSRDGQQDTDIENAKKNNPTSK
jgi:tetratricopeptide (TPR) repeat protein